MISKFQGGSKRLMERAAEEVKDVMNAPVTPLPPKVQRRGAAGAIAQTMMEALPIDRVMTLDPRRVRIREGYERADEEYNDTEFKELVESIREARVNISPVDVRLISGAPGFDAELLAGTRRLRACIEAGVSVAANVRRCDNRTADMLHETENKHRKTKSPYSRGIQYKAMLESGEYKGITDLAESIKTRKQEISDAVNLIEKAPAGMWDKVSNPGAMKTTQVRPLMSAYQNPAFAKGVAAASRVTIDELVQIAQKALRPSPVAAKTDVARIGRRGKDYVVLLPAGLGKDIAEEALKAVEEVLKKGRK